MRHLPFLNKLKKTLNRSSISMEDAAFKVETLVEESTKIHPPAIFIPTELNKVTQTPKETDLAAEMKRINGGLCTHQPLKRYTFRDVLVFPNGFCTKNGGTFSRYGPLPIKEILTQKPIHIDRAIFPMSPCSIQYFGHWLRESCLTALLQQKGEKLILPCRNDWPHTQGYVNFFDLDPVDGTVFHVGELTWYQDYASNHSLTERHMERKRRLKAKIKTPVKSPRVYIKRGRTGVSRELENETILIKHLKAQGFIIADIETDSLSEILGKCLDAEIIITVEGSQQNHGIIALKKGGFLMCIQPSDMFNNIAKGILDPIGMDYGFVVAERNVNTGQYIVDIDAIDKTIQLWEEKNASV